MNTPAPSSSRVESPHADIPTRRAWGSGRRPKKSLGQHFLIDRRVLSRIVGAAELSADDTVVEVGPGRGLLTDALAARAGRVAAVELDAELASTLEARYQDLTHVSVVSADARDVDIDSIVGPGVPYKLVANLPYYAASAIVRRFLESDRSPDLMVIMVQREVAERMTAAPGGMSVLSVGVQLYGEPRVVCHVPPAAFRPRPKVSSTVVRIDVRPRPALDLRSEADFFEVVRGGFSAPRKQLRNTLKQGLGLEPAQVVEILSAAGIDHTRRPRTLSLEDWGRVYEETRLRR